MMNETIMNKVEAMELAEEVKENMTHILKQFFDENYKVGFKCSSTNELKVALSWLYFMGIEKTSTGHSVFKLPSLSLDSRDNCFITQDITIKTEEDECTRFYYPSHEIKRDLYNKLIQFYDKNIILEEKKENEKMENYIVSDEVKENIVYNMKKVLGKYNWDYTESALKKIVDTCVENKQEIINILSKHPQWNPDKLYIHFDQDYNRSIETESFDTFVGQIYYLSQERVKEVKEKVLEIINLESVRENNYFCNCDKWSDIKYIRYFFDDLKFYIDNRSVNKEAEKWLTECYPALKAKQGQKYSRVINKYCTMIGLDKEEWYNRYYAKIADGLSAKTIKRHTVISVNPVDYLLMSNGNSWSSCHSIDVNNIEDRPNNFDGCYCGGTTSYMLDKASFVFYTVSPDKMHDVEMERKELRQMFHYMDYKLLQGRLYPQSNDSPTSLELRTEIRELVQEIIANGLGINNLWKTIKRRPYKPFVEKYSDGVQYKDYLEFDTCRMSYPREMENEIMYTKIMEIGEKPICIECGYTHSIDSTINCCHTQTGYVCEECGCYVDEDDVIWVDGYPYCPDCVIWSEIMEEYILDDSYNNVEVRTKWGTEVVTESYANNSGNVFYCDKCEEYFLSRHYDYSITSDGNTICEDCYDNFYARCEECGEIIDIDDTILDENGYYYCTDCFAKLKTEDENEIEIEFDEEILELVSFDEE